MKIRLESWVDLAFCLLVLPSLLLLFPLEEWAGWHASYVLLYILWLYGCWFLDRRVLAPMLLGGRRKVWTALPLLFLVTVITFLMSLTQVSFPENMDALPRLEPHQQALWLLYITVTAFAFATGLLATRIRILEERQEEDEREKDTRETLRSRASEAVAGEGITVKADYKDVFIPLSAIQYIESRNNYACLHLDHQDDVVTQTTLKSLLELLPEGKFIRIHRSYIIPAWRIETRRATSVKLIGVDTPLPVGRAHKDNLK